MNNKGWEIVAHIEDLKLFYFRTTEEEVLSLRKVLDSQDIKYIVSEKEAICCYCYNDNQYVSDISRPALNGKYYHNDCYYTCLSHGEL